ncbi:MAG: DUF1365 domain-containing protein [Gammaproteobacteria bacterium]
MKAVHSAIYDGQVAHRRHQPSTNEFRYRLYQLYVDLDEMDALFNRRGLFSTRPFSAARFRRDDHLGPANEPLKESVRKLLGEHGYELRGPVRLLTHFRFLGYASNPVSFYYCFDASGEVVERVIAEVTNTPWGEQHCYVLGEGEAAAGNITFEFDKAFHVSPFMTMDTAYEWRFSEPGPALRVHNNTTRNGVKIFDATLNLTRRPLTRANLWRLWLRQPLMTFKVTALIYFQAARLWFKRVPFVSHPKKSSGQIEE